MKADYFYAPVYQILSAAFMRANTQEGAKIKKRSKIHIQEVFAPDQSPHYQGFS